MGDLRYAAIAALLRTLHLTGLDRALAPALRGRGVILTMHHVRPDSSRDFAPNRILEITPDFLDEVIRLLKARGFDIVPLAEAPVRLAAANAAAPPFAVLTFDDGYRDNLEYALPVLEAHGAPCTVFVTTGFAEGAAPLWWLDLEEVIARQTSVSVPLPSGRISLGSRTPEEKTAAFEKIYWMLRPGPEDVLRAVIAAMAQEAGIDPLARTRALCLGWDGLRDLAASPLVSIGAHTLTHPMLAKHDEATVRTELTEAKAIIERQFGRDVTMLAYPVGDPGSAAAREFTLARAAGYEIAVTTRPGMLFAEHARHLTALPRISLNGLFQRRGDVAALLSGVPTALQNRGRRLNVS